MTEGRRRDLLLTFDYELYLGKRSGTPSSCLINPTKALLQVLRRHRVRAVFFVDTMALKAVGSQNALLDDFKKISEQISGIHSEGHYVFPHVHPHWLDAKYLADLRQFDLTNKSRYSFAALSDEEVDKMLDNSISTLRDLGINHSEWGYRAGGWCLQPFRRFVPIFRKHKINYDFSVLPGYGNTDPSQSFDYTCVPNSDPYRFSDILELPESRGNFVEFPISVTELSSGTRLADRLIRKALWHIGDRGWGDGLSAQTVNLSGGLPMISMDSLTQAGVHVYRAYLKKNRYMHWISHPKMLTRHSIGCLDRFLKDSSSKYELCFDFKNMIPELQL